MRFDRRLIATIGIAAMLAACEQERFVGPNAPLDGDSDDFLLDLKDAGGFPSGVSTITSFELVADVSAPDAFQRSGIGALYNPELVRYEVHEGTRIAGQDPRLPELAPLPDPSAVSTPFARIMGPEYWGANMWDLYMRWEGMEPGARYTFALERLATKVNGLVDHLEMLLYGAVTEPDELVSLGGAPGGYPDNDYTWTSAEGCQAEPVPDPLPNPWFLGAFTANSSGVGTADYCMGTPWRWYEKKTSPPVAESSNVVPNTMDVTGGVPEYQYNYVVVYKGEPPNLGPPVLRIQVGVDLDLQGNPIPNAFAPFPRFEDRLGLISVPGVQARVSGLELTATSLAPLAGSQYSLWLFDAGSGNMAAATADYTRIRRVQTGTDESGNPVFEDDPQPTVRTATFNPDAANERHHFVIGPQTLGGIAARDFTHVLIVPGEAQPTNAAPFWTRYLDDRGTPDPDDDALVEGPLQFGALEFANPGTPRIFQATGGAEGSFWAHRLGIAFQTLRRPPAGYYYAVWLVPESGEPVELGPLATPPPELASLRDADMDQSFAVVTDGEILKAGFYIEESDLGKPWSAFQSLRVTLQPKIGARGMSPHTVLSGPLPERLFRGQ